MEFQITAGRNNVFQNEINKLQLKRQRLQKDVPQILSSLH